MKAIRKLSLMLLAVLLFAVTASAAQFATTNELYTDWEINGYPDYVAGAYSIDGGMEMAILLVEGFEAEAETLQALVDEELTFAFGAKYSHNELMQIHAAIVALMMEENTPITGCGCGWTVLDGEVTGFGESGKESRVTVTVLPEAAQEYADRFYLEYGDAVVVESGGYAVETSEGLGMKDSLVLDGGRTENPGWPLWVRLLIFAFVLCCALAVLTLRRRAVQTADQVRKSNPPAPKADFEDLKKRL